MTVTLANGRMYPLNELSMLELVAAMHASTCTVEAKHLIIAEFVRRSKEQ